MAINIEYRLPAPIKVSTVGGRRCLLSIELGQIWADNGKLVALELLSRLRCCRSGDEVAPDKFFHQATAAEQLHIFLWQLEFLESLAEACRGREILVSVNMSRLLASSILASPLVSNQVRLLADIMRLVVSENFIRQGCMPGKDILINRISTLVPLWLDDFGLGGAGLPWLMNGAFDAIKIDRHLFESLFVHPHGKSFLQSLVILLKDNGTQVITRGVSDTERWQFAQECGVVSVCKGKWSHHGIIECEYDS